MKPESKLARRIESGEFVVTAEMLPPLGTDCSGRVELFTGLSGLTAVNVADNPFGPVMSSLAGSAALLKAGVEPVMQVVTRDRNRIAIQSDLLGAVSLGVRNFMFLSGFHQTLTSSPESRNVYDIDPVQTIRAAVSMRDDGTLINGGLIDGGFPVLVGAAANPFTEPMELNIIKAAKKAACGASFIQTQAIFDAEAFERWLKAVRNAKIFPDTTILAGVLPLLSSDEAERLSGGYSDYYIPDDLVDRLRSAGDTEAQRREGMLICTELIAALRGMEGVGGIHIISGGKETLLPDLLS